LSATSVAPATAQYKDAAIEIYKAVTIPVIDGSYNMTLKDVTIDGKSVAVDEWSDAAWIEIPERYGNITVYSGYKHDDQFLYMAHVVMVTHLSSGPGDILSHATTAFNPNHEVETKETKWDGFFKLDLQHTQKGFFFDLRFPYLKGGNLPISSSMCPSSVPDPPGCEYGCCDTCSPCKGPEGLLGNSSFGLTPFGSTPYLFYEARVPLIANQQYSNYNLLKNPVIGIEQSVYNQNMGENDYPCEPESCNINGVSVNNFADATFSNTTNPNLTVPPTIVPEFPMGFVPEVAALTMIACLVTLTRVRRGHSQRIQKSEAAETCSMRLS
jgi:hypothetical protein